MSGKVPCGESEVLAKEPGAGDGWEGLLRGAAVVEVLGELRPEALDCAFRSCSHWDKARAAAPAVKAMAVVSVWLP